MHVGDMSLDWTVALPMQRLVLVGCLAQPALYTDIEMDSLATREPFPPSSLQLTFFTSTVICVHTSQINRISLAAV